MDETVQLRIANAILSAKQSYHKLVILLGKAGSGKTGVLRRLAAVNDTEVININLAVSTQLLELSPRQRILRLPEIVETIMSHVPSTLAILDNIEILFDRSLQQNPLRLLQGLSRNHLIVVAWNGAIEDGRLNYAEAGHAEYRNYELGTTVTVEMAPAVIPDSAQIVTGDK